MTVLEVVGALVALAGTALVLNIIFSIDRLTSPSMAVSTATPAAPSEKLKPTPHRQAA